MVFFTYIDWTLEDQPRPFYVGKGTIDRVNIRERNERWCRIAAKYGWRREVVLATKEEAYAFEQEILGILELGTFKGSSTFRWGANMTAGGDGITGYQHSARTKQKIRRAVSGCNHPMYGKHGIDNPNFGRRETDEQRAARSGSNHRMYGKTVSDDLIMKWSGANNHMYGRVGTMHPRYGTKHTQSSIEKMRSNATLTWDNVASIRAKFNAGISCKALSAEFGVSYKAIWKVVNHKTWKPSVESMVP